MIDTGIALGLSYNFKTLEDLIPAILLKEYNPWPIGSPIIVSKTALEEFSKKEYHTKGVNIAAQQLMIGSANHPTAGQTLGPNLKTVRPFGDEKLIDNHHVVEIDFFEPRKLKRLTEYVHDIGSISFIIAGEVGQRGFPSEIAAVVKHYKYHTITYYNAWFSNGRYLKDDKDKKLTLVNLFDIKYCIPIFNFRNVDGIGLSWNLITLSASKDYGRPHLLAEMDMIFSNYEDNLFVLDGATIIDPWHYSYSERTQAQEWVSREIPIGSAKKESARPDAYTKFNNYKAGVELYYEGTPVYKSTDEWHNASSGGVKFYTTGSDGWVTSSNTTSNEED